MTNTTRFECKHTLATILGHTISVGCPLASGRRRVATLRNGAAAVQVDMGWMFDLTPEEERQMRDAEWDLEDVKLGPVEERYTQPSLLVNEYEHTKTLAEANEVSRRVDRYISGEDVCPPSQSLACLLLMIQV